MNDVSRSEFSEMVRDFTDKAEQLERKLAEIETETANADRDGYARGLADGIAAKELDVGGKVVIVKVPEDYIEDMVASMPKIQRQLRCRLVVLADYADLKDLHEVDLKALGLKKLE